MYKTGVLPLNYRGIRLVPPLRFELRELLLLREPTLPICPRGHKSLVPKNGFEPGSLVVYLVGGLGIEPSSTALQAVAEITRLAHLPKTFRIVLFQQ